MLKAMRVSRASEVAIRAVRLFRCVDCPHILAPRPPRPSNIPLAEEFNAQIGLDVFQGKDADGQTWCWLNVLCQATTFQVCSLLQDTHSNPTSASVLQAFETSWASWAGYPEYGIFTDRAKYFVTDFADALASEGCHFDTSARASPWQLGQIERHGDIWKGILKRMVWGEQLAGKDDMIHATSAINAAKNSLVRKAGFSPSQWVLGRSIRLPADLTDDGEAVRLGTLALSATPSSRFYYKSKLRFSAREAFVKVSNSEALKRAELRQVRPSRGPFPVGTWVFYYDASDQTPGPLCWRGVARVIGHEGSHTIWVSHRGIILAVSPEQLSLAFQQEVEQWTTLGAEMELLDSQPPAGGTGFIDLRRKPKPPAEGFPEVEDQEEDQPMLPAQDVAEPPSDAPAGDDELARGEPPAGTPGSVPEQPASDATEDLSASSTSMGRIRLESERDARRAVKSSAFFKKRDDARRKKQGEERKKYRSELQSPMLDPVLVPVPEYDPDVDDYHQARVPKRPTVFPSTPEEEADEREAKRLRGADEEPDDAALFAYLVVEQEGFLTHEAKKRFYQSEESYSALGVSIDDFLFGFRRNVFEDKYLAMYEYAMGANAPPANVKKGRKELRLADQPADIREKFTGVGGSDDREWQAWISKDACEIVDEATSAQIRSQRPDLVIPTRWVRTNKHEGLEGKEFLAKSRLVVQGFKDKSLGHYRRDAPTASSIAESICLLVSAHMGFVLISKDVKNAYFSGRSLDREVYLEQPKGGLRGVQPGRLLRARKAIYGFSEAARLFWVALKGHLESDGWRESRLEPALFYLREPDSKELLGILVTHVDDLEGGVKEEYMVSAFEKSAKALEFATNHARDFIFRGREIKQHADGHIDVSMRNYAINTKRIHIAAARKAQTQSSLTVEEKMLYESAAGELGWLTRQLRCDLAYEHGVAQRSKRSACVGDLIRLRQYLSQARRNADFRMRYWSDVNLSDAIVLLLADSGHANGTPEKDDILRYRSVGGYFVLVCNKEVLEDQPARANVLCFHSSQTKRVCRSTLAAEASHLAEAVEAGDWCICLLEEALTDQLNLKDWPEAIRRRKRVYVTDAKSVYDYLHKDATSTSTDKRMAIEGALLRETVRQEGAAVRWVDGMQNIADVLTKATADKTFLKQFLRDGMISLVQSPENRALKEKKRSERQKRSANSKKPEMKLKADDARRQRLADEIAAEGSSTSDQQE